MTASRNIEGLLFDLGGVLVEIDFERALQAWNQWTSLSIEELRLRFKMDEAYEKHERGEIEAAEYFTHLRNVLELEANDSEIILGWNAIFLSEVVETVDHVQAVKEKLPCFVFTNSNPTHQDYWMSAFPRVVESFQEIFVSSNLRLRKPEPRAFEAIADSTGISLDAILFFDDTEENVRGAQAVGMHAIYVEEHKDVEQALAEIGAL